MEIKINIGCGPNGQLDGFINIDNSKAVILNKFKLLKKILYYTRVISTEKYLHDWRDVVYMNTAKKIKFHDSVVSKIYCSHFLEHLTKEQGEKFISEMYRVLIKGGVVRIVLPDLLWHSKKYINETKLLIQNNNVVTSRTIHDNYLHTIYGSYLSNKRKGLLHSYMYDLPTIFYILKQYGFKKIQNYDFQQGCDRELKNYDNRPEDSIHIECYKI